MKIALYKSVKYKHFSVGEVEAFENSIDFVKISESMDVEFIDLDKSEINKKELALIDDEITNEMADSESRINMLKQKRQELLAIGSDE